MQLLDDLRVFSPDFIYTAPYVSWVRLLVCAMTFGILVACVKSLPVWSRATLTLAKSLRSSSMNLPAFLENLVAPRLHMTALFGTLSGALLEMALLYRPSSVMALLNEGFLSFATLDTAGWMAVASVILMAWLILVVWMPSIVHLGFIAGTVDIVPYLLYAGACYFFGMLLGPVLALILLMQLRRIGIQTVISYFYNFAMIPFFALYALTLPASARRAATDGKSRKMFSLSSALNIVDGRD